ncbi:HAMP domain-containing sensor histidine kinase [Bacillus sp. B15-48]|uniref:sensor histidine kinase n=1 Tax=Bacillus sp. B15-48 TaxID=1548601 RepID=UPI00193F12D2|nr:HAMP domain-containing sensor histidine kinase [Bacillus sp. B15-48]MBM4760785.1 HAMP domain-containing protein [Bacillus sp. B15-48]
MKLRNKIHLSTSVLFICLLLFINISIYLSFSKMMLNRELERTEAEAKQAINGINQVGAGVEIEAILLAYVPVNGMLQIIDSNGNRGGAVAAPGQQNLREEWPAIFQQKEIKKIVEYDKIPHAFVSIPMISREGEVVELQVTESLVATAEMLNTLKLVLIVVSIIATIPVVISSRFLSNFITRPITSMIETMRDIKESGQFKRIPLERKSNDELYLMGDTFNNMIELLEVNYEKQGQFISNASHELKTPLTVIESYASLLKRRGKEQPELLAESVQAIHSEAIRMKDLTQQLLMLARHEEQWLLEVEEINLNEVVEEVVRSFQKAYNRDIEWHQSTEVIIKADLQKLKQLFYIIIDNARKYSEEVISVSVTKSQDQAIVKVIDRGIGIPKAELEKVFDRFYRVDQARSRKTGGFGLGLSLAKELVDVMGAEITLESVEGLGTTVTICFPLVSSH